VFGRRVVEIEPASTQGARQGELFPTQQVRFVQPEDFTLQTGYMRLVQRLVRLVKERDTNALPD
jgi:hypothetical protein